MLRNKKPKRHVSCQRREERPVSAGVGESWSMDLMSDELFDGRRIRLLTIVDNFTRESLAIKVAASIKGEAVVGQGYRIWISGGHFRGQPLLSIAYFGG